MAKRYVDLTLPIQVGMATFPVHWHPVVEITQLGRHGIENRETRKLVLGTHTGTHCDAPLHFIEGGASVDDLPLDLLIGEAVVLDFSGCADRQEITVGDLERKLGERRPVRIVFRYDWAQHFGTMKYYSDLPFLSEDAAKWLVGRGVRLVAMDTPMPDNPQNGRNSGHDSPNHKTLLGNGVVIVEYLCNLDRLPEGDIELIVLPLKIAGGDGSPVRAVAGIAE